MSNPHIVNQDDLSWTNHESGEAFAASIKQLGAATGGDQLGCSLIRLQPGKRGWPFHYHFANEEAIYILQGKGTMRLGNSLEQVKAGDYIAMPAEPDLGHQLINTSDAELVYLCMSTMKQPDVCCYPDSDKIGLLAGSAPGRNDEQRAETAFFQRGTDVSYWQGESE